MKKTPIASLVLFMVLLSADNLLAQQLEPDREVPPFAIGLRADPDGAGITAKYFFIETVSAEVMINGSDGTYNGNGPSTSFVALLEYNFLFNDPAWRIFMGPGAHITSWKQYADDNAPRQTAYGLDAIIGAEYIFYEVPIGISIDIKPAMNFYNGVTSFPDNTFGLAVRYYFGNWNKKELQNENAIESGHGH